MPTSLTAAQLATFKAAINGDAALAADRAAGNQGAIANYYNANGASTVWRPSITVKELNTAIVWSEHAVLTALLQGTYTAMTQGGFIDATSVNVRNGFSTIFGAGTASRTALIALVQRTGTRFELVFAVAQVTPLFGRACTVDDVVTALAS